MIDLLIANNAIFRDSLTLTSLRNPTYIPYTTHDILIYLFFLIKASLELEPFQSRDLIYLKFSRFFKILFEKVIVDPKVNRDLSVYF